MTGGLIPAALPVLNGLISSALVAATADARHPQRFIAARFW
jgi:hypothetical protein